MHGFYTIINTDDGETWGSGRGNGPEMAADRDCSARKEGWNSVILYKEPGREKAEGGQVYELLQNVNFHAERS